MVGILKNMVDCDPENEFERYSLGSNGNEELDRLSRSIPGSKEHSKLLRILSEKNQTSSRSDRMLDRLIYASLAIASGIYLGYKIYEAFVN